MSIRMAVNISTGILISAMGIALTVIVTAARADNAPLSAPSSVVKDLMMRDLVNVPGKELLMLTVEYVPGGASLPHRHSAQVFVYVLAGTIRMQVKGSPVATLHPGDTFYEGPDDIHTVSANASRVKPAQILVFMVKDKNAPVSSAVPSKDRP